MWNCSCIGYEIINRIIIKVGIQYNYGTIDTNVLKFPKRVDLLFFITYYLGVTGVNYSYYLFFKSSVKKRYIF